MLWAHLVVLSLIMFIVMPNSEHTQETPYNVFSCPTHISGFKATQDFVFKKIIMVKKLIHFEERQHNMIVWMIVSASFDVSDLISCTHGVTVILILEREL
jgi:hypothetical protein